MMMPVVLSNPKPKQETNKTNIRKSVAQGVGTDDERARRAATYFE
jgi:hypothetical protein